MMQCKLGYGCGVVGCGDVIWCGVNLCVHVSGGVVRFGDDAVV